MSIGESYLYWYDLATTDVIRMNTATGYITTIKTGLTTQLVIPLGDYVYWLDEDTSDVVRWSQSGGEEVLFTVVGTLPQIIVPDRWGNIYWRDPTLILNTNLIKWEAETDTINTVWTGFTTALIIPDGYGDLIWSDLISGEIIRWDTETDTANIIAPGAPLATYLTPDQQYGYLYTWSDVDNTIYRWNIAEEQLEPVVEPEAGPYGYVSVSGNDVLYWCEADTGDLVKYELSTSTRTVIHTGVTTAAVMPVGTPRQVYVGSKMVLFVADPTSGVVHALVDLYGTPKLITIIHDTLALPMVDRNGNVYLIKPDPVDGKIIKWDIRTGLTSDLVTGIENISYSYMDSDGSIYVSMYGEDAVNPKIIKWDASTQTVSDVIAGVSSSGMAVDKDGNLHIADLGSSDIAKWDGVSLDYLGLSDIAEPMCMVFDKDSNLYIVNNIYNDVEDSYTCEIIKWDGVSQSTIPLSGIDRADFILIHPREGWIMVGNMSSGVYWDGAAEHAITVPPGVLSAAGMAYYTFSGLIPYGLRNSVEPPNEQPTGEQLTGVVYSQSNVYSGNNAADYEYMNNGNADGSINDDQTGLDGVPDNFVKADCGEVLYINRIVIGYDYLNNLPGGWGTYYTEGLEVQGSTDDSSWTTITTTPVYSLTGSTDGLVSIPIDGEWRYIRLYRENSNYMALLEFEIWGTPS